MIRYILNKKTEALIEEFDLYGNCYTRIIAGEKNFVVKLSIKKIFEDTLNYYCGTLEGAIRGAKSILGEKYHPPILINANEGLIMIPCGPTGRKHSIWIANNHIFNLDQLGKETIIYTHYGHQIIVTMKIKQIEMKMGQASRLQTTQIYRTKREMAFYYERDKQFILRIKTGERNMSVQEKEEE